MMKSNKSSFLQLASNKFFLQVRWKDKVASQPALQVAIYLMAKPALSKG